jgi:hypothetical protein
VLAQEKLAKQQVTVLPHPQHSLDLTPYNTIPFPFLSPLKGKATCVIISVSQRDHKCHKGGNTGPSSKYLSALFPVAISTLADLHSDQW